MTQSNNVKYVLIAVSIIVSLHLHATSVPVFNGLIYFFIGVNKSKFHLGVFGLDLSFQIEKSVVVTNASSNEEKTHYRA